MRDVSRRSFLGGALTVAAASLAPVAAFKALGLDDVPTLWGDAVHDDTPALQALIDGKPFIIADTGLVTRNGPGDVTWGGPNTRFLPKGTFRVESAITIPKGMLLQGR